VAGANDKLLERIDIKAEAGLCAGTFAGAREFLKDVRVIVSEARAALSATSPAPAAALAAGNPLDNPDMAWLWTHCRAIGMTKKSDSGLMKDDIGLFTATQKDMIDGLALLAKLQPEAAELKNDRWCDDVLSDHIGRRPAEGNPALLLKWYRSLIRGAADRALRGPVVPQWPIRGVRVDGDTVILSVNGGNDAARWLCGELVAMIPQKSAK
jgi:hypothetical protein